MGGEVLGVVDYGLSLHSRVYRSFESGVFSPRNVVVGGCGPFCGGRLFGGHRVVFVFRSPVSRGIHVSAMGGAGYSLVRAGVHGFVVEGFSEEPVVFVLRHVDGRFEGWMEEVGWDRLWSVWRGYSGLRGVRGFTRFLVDRFWDDVLRFNGRAVVVGPGAARTIYGGLFSVGLRGRGLDPAAFDSASRGGGGSVLLRAHGVAGVLFGGFYDSALSPRLRDLGFIDGLARRVLGRGFVDAVSSSTVKYRFDPGLGTGGTFGVNYVHYRGLVPFLGYSSVYLSRVSRERFVEAILEGLWSPVQRDVFEAKAKPWGTCGEPCPAVCKKVWRGVKIDYEPSNAMGPFIGVFDAEETRRLIELVDDLGVDVIEAGHIVAWVFGLVSRGLLSPEDVGISGSPIFEPVDFAFEEASRRNARLAREVLEGLVEGKNWFFVLLASRGVRAAAAALNLRFSGRLALHGLRFQDLVVYAAFGRDGYMTPNYYWSPGVVAPLPVLGRYWTVYSPSFSEPEAAAEVAVVRARMEYLIDNAGFCRFHRKWVERLLPHLYREVLGINVDLVEHANKMLRSVLEYQEKAGAAPAPWESRRVVDMVAGIAAEMGFEEWAFRLASSEDAAFEWWRRFYARIRELLGLGDEGSGEDVESH